MNILLPLVLFVTAVHCQEAQEVKIGDLVKGQHRVAGALYAINETNLLLKNFEYDGQAPDAFFWVGNSSVPSRQGTILPYPFEGKFFEYEDKSAPVLEKYDGTKDLVLQLPTTLKVSNLKWFSVWCREYGINFGEVIFPQDFNLEKVTFPETTTAKPQDLPPPLVHPSNDLDDGHHHDDEDVKAEPEAEAEPDIHDGRHRNSATNITISSSIILLSYIISKYLL